MAEVSSDTDPDDQFPDEIDPDDIEFDEFHEFDDQLGDQLGDEEGDEAGVEFDARPIDSSLDDRALIESARRRHGALGGLMAAGMLGIDKVLGRKPREEVPIVVAAPTEPIDIDTEGITVALDEHTDLVAPPLPRSEPKAAAARRRRR
ncbi:MAG: hypothetical protein JWN99_2853 [Ilumatobacteraceae bacterium]|nr:hypothetical protein [Ilumatobacteraceae bacterium]